MVLSIEDTDQAIRNSFYSMEEDVDYILDNSFFQQLQTYRKREDVSALECSDCVFHRKGDALFLNGERLFIFSHKDNLAVRMTFHFERKRRDKHAFAMARRRALPLALQYNAFCKKQNSDESSDLIQINGKKYKLVAV